MLATLLPAAFLSSKGCHAESTLIHLPKNDKMGGNSQGWRRPYPLYTQVVTSPRWRTSIRLQETCWMKSSSSSSSKICFTDRPEAPPPKRLRPPASPNQQGLENSLGILPEISAMLIDWHPSSVWLVNSPYDSYLESIKSQDLAADSSVWRC